ncbi:hypothetical protein AAFF_G00298750 [Aldrovandia affinis]|uniref:Uncharacterized protein n=1 Tax=Aldrovandia affinis TaxID=143900 RepID=A0AAD7R8U4_9TELE|nr:hypothetical protein AAFF_G00298750 [Aldrovandia affinis]
MWHRSACFTSGTPGVSRLPVISWSPQVGPTLYQQATINIPGLTQQNIPLQTRTAQLCAQTEPFQQTLIICPPIIQGALGLELTVNRVRLLSLGRGSHGGQYNGVVQQASVLGGHMSLAATQPLTFGVAHVVRPQQGCTSGKRMMSLLEPLAPVAPNSPLLNSPAYNAMLSQPIILSDTPSPAVSIITIHSDTEDEDERKFHPASCRVSQQANAISCVTVQDSHDSESSTCSPLTPKCLHNFAESAAHFSKSLAIIVPSVKSQPGEGAASKPAMGTSPWGFLQLSGSPQI